MPRFSAVSVMAHGLNMVARTNQAEHPALHSDTSMLRTVIATPAQPDLCHRP